MRYNLSNYHEYMALDGIRIEVYPNKEIAAKLVAGYEDYGYIAKPLYKLIPCTTKDIPSPKQVVDCLNSSMRDDDGNTVFYGLDAYLAFLSDGERRDFFIGLRNLLDTGKANARFLISNRFMESRLFANPRYQGGLQIVNFDGNADEDNGLSITLVRKDWIGCKADAEMTVAALKALGEYKPSGSFVFSVEASSAPNFDRGYVTILRKPLAALKALYGIEAAFSEDCAEALLNECADKPESPMDVLSAKFGADNIVIERAPLRLQELANDSMWGCYVWMLKAKINADSYLSQVLDNVQDAQKFIKCYVVDTALSLIGHENATAYANERAAVLNGRPEYESLISGFIAATEDNDKALCFLNCGTETELKALIRHAKKLEHTYGLPEIYDKIAPVLNQYLSPYFDYGNAELTSYFHDLRCFRMSDSINEAFVRRAYEATIPKTVKERDETICSFDDEDTALLVVDGMGAEYYPLLLNMAQQNGLNIDSKQIVLTKLPSSTEYNRIKWPLKRMLKGVHSVDNISHAGYSAHEQCAFEENLAAIFSAFRKDIFPRIIHALSNYKKVLVTADHGASYLAVNAHRDKLDSTLDWTCGEPTDWRYTVLNQQTTTPEGMVSVYSPERQQWFYVVKGYNRLRKPGGKLYALHGGATLEEALVPLVIFTNDAIPADESDDTGEFIENDAFDIL